MQVIHKAKQYKQVIRHSIADIANIANVGNSTSNTNHVYATRILRHKPHMGITPHHILSLLLLLGCSSLILMGAVYGNKTSNSDNVSAMKAGDVATLSATALPSLELSMASNVSLSIEPTAEGQFSRSPLNIYVNTNSTSGYTLTMMASEGGDGSGALKRDRMVLGQNYYIHTLNENTTCTDESDTTCDNFPSGYWGYRIDGITEEGTYLPIESYINNATEIKKTESSTGSVNDTTTVYFGSKLDNTTPAGDYSGVSLTFAVTTNIFQWSINYHAGNSSVLAEDVKGLPSQPQSGTIDSDDETGEKKVNLAGAPTRTGYAFIGWCETEPTTTGGGSAGTTDTCPEGSQYSAGQEVTIRINGPSVLDFYAMWTSAKVSVTFNLSTGVKSLTVRGYFGENMEMQDYTIKNKTTETLSLAAASEYILTPEYSEGYQAPAGDAYTKSGAGTLKANVFTTGTSESTVTAQSKIKSDLSLIVTWNAGVEKVDVYENVVSGSPKATITKSGDSTGNILTFGYNYYLVPEFTDGYIIASWDKGEDQDGKPVVGEINTSKDTCGTVSQAWYTIGDGINIADLAAQEKITIAENMTMTSLAGQKDRLIQSMELEKTYTVVDTRGGTQSYQIAKLKDCNIWMVDNLNLGGSATIQLSSDDTNIAVNGDGTKATWNLPTLTPDVKNTHDENYTTAILHRPIGTAKTYVNSNWVDTTEAEKGILYNYAAASAGTITTNSNSTLQEYDICPKGWHLPSGGGAGKEFSDLAIAYGGTATGSFASSTQAYEDFNNAFHTTLSGRFSSGSLNNVGSIGYFWSSTAYSAANRHILYVNTSNVEPANRNYRNFGYSVRCVLK